MGKDVNLNFDTLSRLPGLSQPYWWWAALGLARVMFLGGEISVGQGGVHHLARGNGEVVALCHFSMPLIKSMSFSQNNF